MVTCSIRRIFLLMERSLDSVFDIALFYINDDGSVL